MSIIALNKENTPLEKSLRLYMRFLGIGETDFVELTALAEKTYTGGARGYDAICALASMGGMLDGVHGIYLVPNRMAGAVSARYAPNEWHRGIDRVKDGEIERRRVVYIDLDPKRPSGTSATDGERRAAKAAADAVVASLKPHLRGRRALGIGSSGNGYQIHLAVDLPNTPEVETKIKRLLSVVSVLHGGDRGYGHPVEVDRSVTNAARLAPAFGTLKTKGFDNSGAEPNPALHRPHRRSVFHFQEPVGERLTEADLTNLVDALEKHLTSEQRTALADLEKKSPLSTPTNGRLGASSKGEGPLAVAKRHPIADVARWLGLLDERGGVRCPGCGENKGVDLLPEVNRLNCQHDRCKSKGRNGNRSTVDLVLEVGGQSATKENVRQAAIDICSQFGLEYRSTPSKEKRTPTDDELAEMGIYIDTHEPSALVSREVPNLEDGPTEAETTPTIEKRRHNLTDLGNAERIRDRHGRDIRYVVAWEMWLRWDGKRWAPDPKALGVRALAQETVRSIYQEAKDVADPDQKRAITAWAKASESTRHLSAMLKEAEALCGMQVDHEQLNADRYLLNVTNGTVNLRTGELRPHCRDDLITKITLVAYNPMADRSLFMGCLETSQPDPVMRAYLLRAWGYSLTGDVGSHVFWVHYGPKGRNGKGTIMNSIAQVLGDYAEPAVPAGVIMDLGNEHPTGLTTLHGKRFCVSSETAKGKRMRVDLVKRLTGGDPITAHRMREDFWTFKPVHHLHMFTNHKPSINEAPDDPVWERVHLVPWTVYIEPEKRIENLDHQLQAEGAEGLLAAIVDGCLAWQREGLRPPDAVRAATAEYRDESDNLNDFVTEHLVLDERAQVTVADLYAEYRRWADAQGFDHPLTKIILGKMLTERGIGVVGKDTKTSQAIRTGVRIRVLADSPVHREREAREQAMADEAIRHFEVAAPVNDVGLGEDIPEFSDALTLDLVEPLIH